MKTIFDNNFLRVWIDGHSPIVFIQWQNNPLNTLDQSKIYGIVNEKSLKAMEPTYKDLYLLLDLSNTNWSEAENLIRQLEVVLAKKIKNTLRYISIVRSQGATNLYYKINSTIPVGVFDNFFEALGTINDLRNKALIWN